MNDLIRALIKVWFQSNLMFLAVIILMKLMTHFNPTLNEPINLWWLMLLPSFAAMIAFPMSYYEHKKIFK